jgi:hypothetical protein
MNTTIKDLAESLAGTAARPTAPPLSNSRR